MFPRVLIGIDRPAPKGQGDIHGWVLGQFTEAQQKILYESEELGLRQAAIIVRDWLHPKPKVKKAPVAPKPKIPKPQNSESLGKRDDAPTEPGAPPVNQKQKHQKAAAPVETEQANPEPNAPPTDPPN